MNLASLNQEICKLKECHEKLQAETHKVIKQSKIINHMLEHAVFEEDLVHHELICFEGSTHDFLECIAPLLQSPAWKVNGVPNREAFLRCFDEVIKIIPKRGEDPIKFTSLLDATKRYFP